MQLALSLLVRNTVLDAAAEGARYSSLLDRGVPAGVERTQSIITTAIGPSYATDVSGTHTTIDGVRMTVITVKAPLPLIGFIGIDDALVVSGHAVEETLD